MIDQFLAEYWMFVESLLLHASELSGVASLNALSASYGYPLGAALLLSAAGLLAALALLSCGRPGWGLAGLAVGEELSALSLASAAIAQGVALDGTIALLRIAAAVLAVALVSALLRQALRFSRETAAAAR